jgi:hypothetical protein
VRAFRRISEQADDVIADRRHRQALDRRLQAHLQLRAPVHGLQQVAVLLLQLDVDPRAQQVCAARELGREVGLARLHRRAGAHDGRHAARQEGRRRAARP